jgi:RecA-family ATPase
MNDDNIPQDGKKVNRRKKPEPGSYEEKELHRKAANTLRKAGFYVAEPDSLEEMQANRRGYLSEKRTEAERLAQEHLSRLGGRLTVEYDDEDAGAFDLTSCRDLAGVEVPEVPFTVEGVVPAQAVTILYGPGKVGKSLLTLQLALAVATGGEWLGQEVLRPGKAIYLGAEDSPASMHKRLALILDAHGLDFAQVPGLMFKSLLGEDTVLARPGAKGGGEVDFTPVFRRVERTVERERPALLVLDTLNRLTTIDINAAVAAARFVQRLGEIAYTHDCAIYLLAHPSLTAMRNGEMSGGSPALFNTARAKHVLRRPTAEEGGQTVPGLRVFWAEHVNDAPESEPIHLRQINGAFHTADPQELAADRARDLEVSVCEFIEERPGEEMTLTAAAKQFREVYRTAFADLKLKDCKELIERLIAREILALEKGPYDAIKKRKPECIVPGPNWADRARQTADREQAAALLDDLDDDADRLLH